MPIREDIAHFLRRASDAFLMGRNGSRIVVGTDRKDAKDSGYGDGSENASPGAAAIDLVAGYSTQDIDWKEDKSRIYMSAMSNPDEYMNMQLGEEVKETPMVGIRTSQFYISVRENIKIRNEKMTILIDKAGNITIETPEETKIKSGDSFVKLEKNGNISIGAENGTARRILTEEDVATTIDPTTGAIQQCKFVVSNGVTHPQAAVKNSKVKIVS